MQQPLARHLIMFSAMLAVAGIAPLCGQSATDTVFTLVFRISAREAESLYIPINKVVATDYMHTRVDSTMLPAQWRPSTPGHYLLANARGEQLALELRSFAPVYAQVMKDQQYFALQVFDESGQAIRDAKVWLNSRPVPYHSESGRYQLPRYDKDGFLKIEAKGHTAFYKVDNSRQYSPARQRWQRFKSSKAGRWAVLPGIVAIRLYQATKALVRGGSPRYYLRFGRRKKDYGGYIALNKPRYLPGDTVKVKAYIANHRHKPYRKPLNLVLRTGNKQITLHSGLQPQTPGNYIYEFPIGDSLQLDKYYSLSLEPKGKKAPLMSGQFQYEDYQLDEISYSLNAPAVRRKGEALQIEAWGKDRNEVFVADGEVQLTVLATGISAVFDSLVRVPDTLWTYRQELRPGEKTTITVPDSIFPAVNINTRVDALFSNSNGELQNRSAVIQYYFQDDQHQSDARIWLEFNEICGAYYGPDGKPDTIPGAIIIQLPGGKETLEQQVTLPCRLPVNPAYRGYELKVLGKTAAVDLKGKHRVYLEGRRSADSLVWMLYNPLQLPVTYTVWDGKSVWERGLCTADSLRWAQASHSAQTMSVQCLFTWAGEPQVVEKTFPRYDQLLRIKIEQPELVAPGETVQVKVLARDFRDKPAKNVQLAAGGINAQFNTGGNYEAPEIQYRLKKNAIVHCDYSAIRLSRLSLQQPLTVEWYDKLRLNDQLYYRMRFEGDGVYAEYMPAPVDTFYGRMAQFAPYLVKNGQLQPIYLIYINRKMVYSTEVDVSPPYSFPGIAGKNTITVRALDAEYTITDVELKNGQKLELAIDVDKYAASEKAKQVSVKSMPREWTPFEKNELNRHTFQLISDRAEHVYYLWNDNSNIHFVPIKPSNRYLRIGPFPPNSQLYLLRQNAFQSKFLFEPGFAYSVSLNRERLYSKNLFQDDKPYFLSEKLKPENPGALMFHPAGVIAKTAEKPMINFTTITNKHQKGQGKLQVEYGNAGDFMLKAIYIIAPDSVRHIFRGNVRRWTGLEPGDYTVFLIAGEGEAFFKKTINISPNSTLCLRWSGVEFTPDSTGAVTWPILYGQQPKPDLSLKPGGWKYGGGSSRLSGKALDPDGEPLIGANVMIYQDNILIAGTTSDIDGNYYIDGLPPGNYAVEISYTGYTAMRVSGVSLYAGLSNQLDLALQSQSYALSEVVVVGYAVPLVSQDMTQAGSSVVDIANLPTRHVNAITGSVAGLAGEDEVGIRGSRSGETDYYIDGIRADALPDVQFDSIDVRSNFKDEAFWQPALVTDRSGAAFFTVTYPDNITAWDAYALGLDRRGRAGVANSRVRALKKLAAQLAVPRFMLEGDSAQVIGKTLHVGGDSLAIATAFQVGGQVLAAQQAVVTQGRVDKTLVTAPAAPDTISLRFAVQSAQYADGEERKIPVLPVGSLESNGVFLLLESDTSFTLEFDPAKGPVTIFAPDNLLAQLLEDLEDLRRYPYGCNEQNAGRLTALLLEKQVRQLLGQTFDAEEDIKRMVVALRKSQNANGTWGWWPQSEGNIRMTTYVLRALHLAAQSGYTTEALEKGLRYLMGRIHLQRGDELLQNLDLLSSVGQALEYERYLAPFDTMKLSLQQHLQLIRIKQQQQLPYTLDSLKNNEQRTLYGGSYWSGPAYQLWRGPVANTVLAYDIVRNAGDTLLCRRIRRYFLQNRRHDGWRNTLESAQILRAILPDLMAGADPNTALRSRLEINGEAVTLPILRNITVPQPIRIDKKGVGALCFTAYQQTFNPLPEPHTGSYTVSTRLEQEGEIVSDLKQGIPARLIVTVDAKEDSEYVMIEAPIPAGCSYLSKPQGRWGSYEVHREYWKHQTAIFCEYLPAGRHEFVIELEPRFSGRYTLNPAKAEQMYFPVLYGREALRRLSIAEH